MKRHDRPAMAASAAGPASPPRGRAGAGEAGRRSSAPRPPLRPGGGSRPAPRRCGGHGFGAPSREREGPAAGAEPSTTSKYIRASGRATVAHRPAPGRTRGRSPRAPPGGADPRAARRWRRRSAPDPARPRSPRPRDDGGAMLTWGEMTAARPAASTSITAMPKFSAFEGSAQTSAAASAEIFACSPGSIPRTSPSTRPRAHRRAPAAAARDPRRPGPTKTSRASGTSPVRRARTLVSTSGAFLCDSRPMCITTGPSVPAEVRATGTRRRPAATWYWSPCTPIGATIRRCPGRGGREESLLVGRDVDCGRLLFEQPALPEHVRHELHARPCWR